jgi:hypothetical protein
MGKAECCFLPTVHCLLPTAHCLLPTAHCPLPTACCPLLTVHSLRNHKLFVVVEALQYVGNVVDRLEAAAETKFYHRIT